AEPPEAGGPRPRNRPGPSRVTEAGGHVLHVQLNRPEKRNAMNRAFWREMVECFNKIAQDPGCRAVVISGAGKMFTSGIDLMDMAGDLLQPQGEDHARVSWNLRQLISRYQETFTVIEKVGLPAPGGGGGGPAPLSFSAPPVCPGPWPGCREGDMSAARRGGAGASQDPGGQSLVNELAFTARKMMADEALGPAPDPGGVPGPSPVRPSPDRRPRPPFPPPSPDPGGLPGPLVPGVPSPDPGPPGPLSARAGPPGAWPPQAADPGPVRPGVSGGSLLAAPWVWPGDSTNPVGAGTKQPVLAGPGVAEGLNFKTAWNMSMLQTEDITKSVQASLEKKDLKGTFQT
ncbi:delta(3,5)-Delta(2,4)-dienoyl-CoA isomerase, mitochondrial, partial [Sarcophilus harrisii]|uniref:delta(3,5)-Delta(2,4)-dienoyl-CoA isomerase, mitochondrial n=1 Tax=Sarcophilus harrisii TaxID=9305 RepID=UPI001301A323